MFDVLRFLSPPFTGVATRHQVSRPCSTGHRGSDATDGRIEEDAAREVGIAPLSEGRLLLEVLLHS